VGASFVMLDRLGKVRVVTGPGSPSETRLRRAQALALSNGAAVRIGRDLISAKLTGQETLVREKLHNAQAGNAIAQLRENLSNAENVDAIRVIEGQAAAHYWSAWRDVPVMFPHKDADRVPEHWLKFGMRCSPLTGGPRLSVNPPNTLLNYVNAIAESECRLAAVVCGLDPGVGLIHTDTANRDSLALDLIETVRPAIEAWLLDWLVREPLRRSDFCEMPNGNCRLTADICSKLSETGPTWAKLVAPWAEFVAHSLYGGRASRSLFSGAYKTPLTQRHRREAKAAKSISMPKTTHVCRGCGTSVHRQSAECWNCAQSTRKMAISDIARKGRVASRRPEAQQKRSRTARYQAIARFAWSPAQLPSWLTREFFLQRIQPQLGKLLPSKLRSRLDVSHYYATKIRKGYVPHPRHWAGLAQLAGVSEEALGNGG
jgi:CRISPR-associated endonuclease Cas1